MIEVYLKAENIEDVIQQLQDNFGGRLSERWGEHTLIFDTPVAKGCVKCIAFDWGVSLMEIDAHFFEDVLIIYDNAHSNPIHFSYCSHGNFSSRFEDEPSYHRVNQFHSSIIVSRKNQKRMLLFPKDNHVILNDIRIVRKEFLKKRNTQVSELNDKLNKIFADDQQELDFAYYSPIHLRMEDFLKSLRELQSEGIIRILQIEGEIYHLLAMHIARHDLYESNQSIPGSLLKDELKIIRQFAKKILDDPSQSYTLDQLSRDSGLSQAKLQEGFKFLYTRTVTEYIRHTRLEAARDLMNTTDLNISQIVYSIGFTSRSYFSKIFKEKYQITPHEFRKQVVVVNEDDEELAGL